MPVYEYQCGACGCEFELLRSRSEKDDAPACTACGKPSTHRKMSACFMRSSGGAEGGSTRLGGSACASCTASSCKSCAAR